MDITTIEDVKKFAHTIVHDKQIAFHPDDDFCDYISDKTKAEELNKLNKECISVCNKLKADIYEIYMCEIQRTIEEIRRSDTNE